MTYRHKQGPQDVTFCSILHTRTDEKAIQLRARAYYPEESFGQLVALGFDVTVFTPAPYQRRRLQRPSMEF